MNLEYLYEDEGRFGTGIDLILSDPVAELNRVAIAPVGPPFRDTTGHVVKVDGSSFLRLAIRGLRYDNAPLHAPAEHIGPGAYGVTPPVVEIQQIKRTGLTHVWIIGLDAAVCLAPQTFYDDVNGHHPSSDNGIFVGLTRKTP